MLALKRRFNTRWPYYRVCTGPWWCPRGQTYDHRCHQHQKWEKRS